MLIYNSLMVSVVGDGPLIYKMVPARYVFRKKQDKALILSEIFLNFAIRKIIHDLKIEDGSDIRACAFDEATIASIVSIVFYSFYSLYRLYSL